MGAARRHATEAVRTSQVSAPSDELPSPFEEVEGNNKVQGVRWFEPYRAARTESVRAIIRTVVSAVEAHERELGLRKKARRPRDQEGLEAAVGALISDLTYNHLAYPGQAVAITRAGRVLGQQSRYRPSFIGKTLPRTLDTLEGLGFITQAKGVASRNGSNRTTISPGAALLQQIGGSDLEVSDFGLRPGRDCIILKRIKSDYWDHGGRIEYTETAEVQRHRERMVEINEWLERAAISLTPAAVEDGVVDPDQRQLRRIFTRGSFTSGGRLFGGFWQSLKKQQRRTGVLIQGRPVVGLDYGQMTPRIAYGREGAIPPIKDAYGVPGLELWRDGVKALMSTMFSTDKRPSRKPQGIGRSLPDRPVGELMDRIMEAHPAIAHLFFTEFCHEAQFIESEILVEVLLRLKSDDIVALPVHDAVMVSEQAVTRTDQVMSAVFKEMTGLEAVISREE